MKALWKFLVAVAALASFGAGAQDVKIESKFADVNGINSSLAVIQRTRGGDWPSGPISEEFDYVDLVWHELEFRENYSFSYAVYNAADEYLGCCYSTRWVGALHSMRTCCSTMST